TFASGYRTKRSPAFLRTTPVKNAYACRSLSNGWSRVREDSTMTQITATLRPGAVINPTLTPTGQTGSSTKTNCCAILKRNASSQQAAASCTSWLGQSKDLKVREVRATIMQQSRSEEHT